MKEISTMTSRLKLSDKNKYILSNIILFLLSFAFTVTDWMIGIFTLTDYILGILGVFLLISGNYKIKRKQTKWILCLLIVIILNIVMNTFSNELFIFKIGIAALIKVAYYTAIIIGLYNYVIDEKLEGLFLKYLNISAIIVCITGIYITIALYTEGELPYEFFWKFTRGDLASYTYGWDSSLIRTKSIFSEPSYLGYYLNIILGINYFNNMNITMNGKLNIIIVLTIILTFSYSSIVILLLIQIMYLIESKKYKVLTWNKNYFIVLILFLGIIFLFKDLINEAIFQRTLAIWSGEDNSSLNRLFTSWQHLNTEHLFMGNGINQTPDIWNIYAYILSDLGIIAFVLSILFTSYILIKNISLGILFVVLNFQKGGYLSSSFWIFLLLIFIFFDKHTKKSKLKREWNRIREL